MEVKDFLPEAKKKYQEHLDFEILKIARGLHEQHELREKKKIWDKCPHLNTSHYNHGRHEQCNDCGASL